MTEYPKYPKWFSEPEMSMWKKRMRAEAKLIYAPILKLLCERIEEKYKEYGTSYLGKDYKFLHKRMMGEVDEFSAEMFSSHLSGENVINEGLDVAICALLIADKRRREENEVLPTFGNPEPF